MNLEEFLENDKFNKITDNELMEISGGGWKQVGKWLIKYGDAAWEFGKGFVDGLTGK